MPDVPTIRQEVLTPLDIAIAGLVEIAALKSNNGHYPNRLERAWTIAEKTLHAIGLEVRRQHIAVPLVTRSFHDENK